MPYAAQPLARGWAAYAWLRGVGRARRPPSRAPSRRPSRLRDERSTPQAKGTVSGALHPRGVSAAQPSRHTLQGLVPPILVLD